jgi:hypothetical protein
MSIYYGQEVEHSFALPKVLPISDTTYCVSVAGEDCRLRAHTLAFLHIKHMEEQAI